MKAILRKIDAADDCSFSIREDILPFLYNHWHYHPELELTFIRKGNGIRLVGDSIQKFEDGDLILLGPGLPHMWRSDAVYFDTNSNKHIEAIAVHFRKDFWGETFLNLPEMKPVHQLLEIAKDGIRIQGRSATLVKEKMEELKSAEGIQRIEGLLSILYIISSSKEYSILSSEGFIPPQDKESADRINLIYNYTFDNFKNAITIKDVAYAVNISRNSFCRYFKKRTNKTYWEFLKGIRIAHARKLLIENRMSIAHICYECGFNNLSNFNRCFKEIERMTPMQYAKLHAGSSVAH